MNRIKLKWTSSFYDQNLYERPEKMPNEYGCVFVPGNSMNGLTKEEGDRNINKIISITLGF